MKFFAECHPGAELAAKRELEKQGYSVEVMHGACIFEAEPEQVLKAAYHFQTITRLVKLLGKGDFENCDWSLANNHIPEKASFRVTVNINVFGVSNLKTQDLASEIGQHINRKVDLEKPDEIVYVYISSETLWGLDILGDLSKRYYRVFSNSRSVKGTFAASLIYFKEFEGDLIDPFSNTGEIAIEQALRESNTSPLRFLKHTKIRGLDMKPVWEDDVRTPTNKIWCVDPLLANIRTARKNAKLAGVDNIISFSRIDVDWLETKFSDQSIGAIITIPPPVSRKNTSTAHLEELCEQAKHILKPEGILVCACLTEETQAALYSASKKKGLILKEEAIFYSGKKGIPVMCYGLM